MSSSLEAGLRQWPAPTLHKVANAGEATRALERIWSPPPSVCAVWMRAPTTRDAPLDAVCIGVESDTGTIAIVARGDAIATTLGWLETHAQAATHSPYVVMPHALPLLRTVPAHTWQPPRVGCIYTAHALLGMGGLRRPSTGTLVESLVATRLGQELYTPLCDEAEALARETVAAIALMRDMTPALRANRLVASLEMECKLLPAVVRMERAGIAFDRKAFTQLTDAWDREREALTLQETPDESRTRRLDKLRSTYAHWGEQFVGADGRIRCHLHPMATDSGRFSCSDPNLQQVPSHGTAPGFRACFTAPEGFRLIVADYSQIELRVAAQIAPCDALRSVFVRGGDPHTTTAATLTGKPAAQISPLERKLAKAINFGFLFGMGARRFRDYAAASYDLELDEQQAQEARAAFLRTYPGIAAWHQRTGQLPRRSRDREVWVTTRLGRRRGFSVDAFSFTTALNIPVQGTAAEGFKLAMIALDEALPAVDGVGVLCVHDEYLAQVPEAYATRARELVVETMIQGMREVVPDVPIAVDAAICEHWEQA